MKKVFLIAYKNLIKEKGRLLITVGGVTFSVVLILLLLGLYLGWSTQMTRFLGNIEADYWVGSRGSSDLSHGISVLPRNTIDQLNETSGIEKVTPLVGRQVSFDFNGKEVYIYLIGQNKDKVVRPYKNIEGKDIPDEGEIVIDVAFAQKEKVKIGDTLSAQGNELRVVGISRGGDVLAYSYAITTESDARRILDAENYTNFFIVKSSDIEKTKGSIQEKLPNVEVITKADFLNNNSMIIKEAFLPIIVVILIVSVIIGIAVIGLTIFTSVIEKGREYGVLKAIGYTGGQLFSIAVIQAVIAGLLGLILGNLLAPLVASLAALFVGGFIYELGTKEIVIVVLAVILMSVISSFIPLRRIISIDPAEVFKA